MISNDYGMYCLDSYTIFRNVGQSIQDHMVEWRCIANRVEYIPEYPRCCNYNGVEITLMRTMILHHISIIGIYRSPRVPMQDLCSTLTFVMDLLCNTHYIYW